MINFVIFDMDGVLVDSELAITLASAEALREWGIDAKIEDFKEFTGMGDDKFIGGAAAKYGAGYDVKMKNRAYEIYLEKAQERVRVFGWSREIIEKLHSSGVRLAVASASDYVKVKKNIECIGVSPEIFDAVVTGSDVERKKPHPDIFLKAFEKVKEAAALKGTDEEKLDISATLVCEDALSGVAAAKAAGMKCAAVTTSFDESRLREQGADYVTDNLSDVISLVCGE